MGSAVGQVAGGITSLFGGRARRQEEKDAQQAFNQSNEDFRNFQFQNNYLGLENTAEDLTVNQQAFNAQAQQTDAALAQGLDAIVQTGGGGGSAQAIANAALQSKQGVSASIAQQEQANQQARVAQASRNQQLERQGAERLQQNQYDQRGTLLSLDSERLGAAKAARAKATEDLIGGIVGAGSIVAGGLIGGGTFGQNLQTNFLGGKSGSEQTPEAYFNQQNRSGFERTFGLGKGIQSVNGGITSCGVSPLGVQPIEAPIFKG